MRTACTWIALVVVATVTSSWRTANAQEPKPAAEGAQIKSFSNDQIILTIQEVQRNGRSEFWVHQVKLKLPGGPQTVLEGIDGGEFSTSLGGANATGCEVIKNDASGLKLCLSGKQDGWEAKEVFELAAGAGILQRKQTYRFLKPFEGAIHPGFRLKAESDIRYTFPLRVHEQPLSGLKPQRRAVEWAVPLPFHLWHNQKLIALYGLDKRGSPGTLDFAPVGEDGRARLRVYYPDSCPDKVLSLFWPPDADTIPGTKQFAEGTELTLTEIIAAKPLAAGDDPLLESERIAASILLPKLPHPAKPKAVADGIANYLKHCGLWETNALGPRQGWFYAMWTGIMKEPAARGGTFDLGWGMGYAAENWMGAVRYWKRTGDTDLLPYVDQMTKNMELFRRGSEPEVPYFDASDGKSFGDGHLARSVWTFSVGHIGSQTIQLYQSFPDYPNAETRKQWLAAATSIGNFLAKQQKPDGDLQDGFDDNNKEVNRQPHRCSARAIVCGLWTRLGQVTGDKAWTDRALRLARAVGPEIKRGEFYHEMLDHAQAMPPDNECFSGEAAYYVLEGLVPLYAETRDPEVLSLCKASAAYGIAWTYFYDLPIPKTYIGISRGGQTCCNHYPVIFVIGPALGMEPLLALSKITGDSFYERMAAEMASYIGNSQIQAPGKPWHGSLVHAILQYRGDTMHMPTLGCHVDPGMSSGNGLAALETWLAHQTQSDAKQ